MNMTLQEIKQWRSHLQASPHTLQRIDALIGMVEELVPRVDWWCRLASRSDDDCSQLTCSECLAPIKAKYGVTE